MDDNERDFRAATKVDQDRAGHRHLETQRQADQQFLDDHLPPVPQRDLSRGQGTNDQSYGLGARVAAAVDQQWQEKG